MRKIYQEYDSLTSKQKGSIDWLYDATGAAISRGLGVPELNREEILDIITIALSNGNIPQIGNIKAETLEDFANAIYKLRKKNRSSKLLK